jgi:hypothetical protein
MGEANEQETCHPLTRARSKVCIMVPIHLKTTDTMEEASTEAMVDTCATGDFIDQDFVSQAKLPTRKLSQPVPVYNVDGTPNEAGSIREVVDVVMVYKGHSERILLAVTRLGKQSMILGISWLDKLKQSVTAAPVLISPDSTRPFRIEADSSDFATGAVLSQVSAEDDKWHPVAFLSKSLSPVERNYEIHDKEMLAIIRALQEWRHFVEGAEHPCEIWTDHKNLEYFMTAKQLNRRQARWSLYLSRFDFTLHHKPGKSMGKPDALSRRADHGTGADDNSDIVLLSPKLFAVRALEGLQLVGPEQSILRDVRQGVKTPEEEPVAKAVRELRNSSTRSLRSAEWSESDGLLYFRGRIYVPPTADLRRRIVSLCHDTKIAGHAGRFKTLELVSRNYWWPNMSRYVGQYVLHCDLCLRTKAQCRLPVGELQPLPIPEDRWDTISVDFISELPESGGYDAIMAVVDSVGKRAHFTETVTTVTASGAANLYLRNVWKLHGLPRKVISDRGPQFVAEFMKELYRLLGIEAASSTAYHPQTDGQTERVNQELEQYLRVFVGERQDDWYALLPLAEFSYNNHVHSSTQQTPFLLDTGRHPRMGFEPHQPPSRVEAVNEFTDRMKATLEEAKSALAKAKDDMARYYNRRRSPAPSFAPGDMVFLDSEDIQTTRPSKKLSHRRLGPYPVESRVGRHAYRLTLPPSMRRLHPVFNVVKLMLAPGSADPIPGRRRNPLPPPELVDGEEEYLVEKILNSRMFRRKLQYLVKWEGYGVEHNTWEYSENVDNAPEKVADFHARNPAAPRRILAMAFGEIPFRPILLTQASSRRLSEGGVIVRGTPFRTSASTCATSPQVSASAMTSFRGKTFASTTTPTALPVSSALPLPLPLPAVSAVPTLPE